MARINWKEGLELERDVAIILQKQEENGIYFDIGKAKYFLTLLEELKEKEYEKIRPFLDYQIINLEAKNKGSDSEEFPFNYVKKIQLKNGEYTSSVLSHYDDYSIVLGPFSRIQIEEPSISKRILVINQLIKYGWKPSIFTDTGQPKLTDEGEPVESLKEVGDFGKSLALWYTYNHRQSQIKGLIKLVRKDGRISATYTGITNTFRRKHKGVANIPRPNSIFGKEMRSLFTVPEGRVFVNADVSGLELRILAHWMRDKDYIDQILKGDIHLYHLSKTGGYIFDGEVDFNNLHSEKSRLADERDIMKTFIYGGVLYGGGDAKAGSIIGKSTKEGKELKETFFKEIPALKNLIDKISKFSEKYGFVPTIDNRKVYIRKDKNGRIKSHTALNAKLQTDGNIITERSLVIIDKRIKEEGLDAIQTLYYHDEFGFECNPKDAERVGEILIDSMRLAGEYYNLNIPITGEYKIGKDWGIH